MGPQRAVRRVGCRMPKLAILLGLHDGERYLRAQLDSLLAQTWTDWVLIVSDDSTSPRGREILAAFADNVGRDRVQVIAGPRCGAAQNYLQLFQNIPAECRFVALCDQDDAWLPGKLDRAVAALMTIPDGQPAAVFGAREVCDRALGRPKRQGAPKHAPGFRNALVQNVMPGNTIVMNAAAAAICAATARQAAGIVAHDWWVYQIISGAGGHILYDQKICVLYRQHSANLVGAGLGVRAVLRRGLAAIGGCHRQWNSAQLQALTAAVDHLSVENQQVLRRFAALRDATMRDRIRLFAGLGLYRQTRAGQAMLWLQTLMGRI